MSKSIQIGCDIGGTFTDVVVVDSTGKVFTDKAFTTPDDLTEGVINALGNVAGEVHEPLESILGNTTRFVNGTTVVTNAIAELRGAKVGLITTTGFRDTLRIARSPRTDERDHQAQANVPDLLPRECIVEVDERIDKTGSVIVSLEREAAVSAIEDLVGRGVESIAISLLWSFANNEHEEMLAALVKELHPEIYVSVSSRLYPMIREYERTVTTVLNSFTGLKVVQYTDQIEARLGELGLKAPISFMQGFGGTLSAQAARERPIALVDSGPAGGVIGGRTLGDELGVENVLTGDMGGTSFDVSVLPEGNVTVTQRVMLREFLTGMSKIDVLAVGAGGGSVGWIDARGVPQVGPHSAGADPGPACYGNGGTEPTVTDAIVALGIIDPDAFLAGRRHLDREASRQALQETLVQPLGGTVETAASVIFRLVTAAMSDAVRSVTVERGKDPRDFTFCSYGGALGVFAASICRQMGIRHAVVPVDAAVFSAHGLLATDDVRLATRSIIWSGGDSSAVAETIAALEEDVLEELASTGHSRDEVEVEWQGDFKFQGQLFELTVPIPREKPLDEALEAVREGFDEQFEAEFGPGTAWVGTPVSLLGVRVLATGRSEKLERAALVESSEERPPPEARWRMVVLPPETEPREVAVYDGADLAPGTKFTGPAVVEDRLTTLLVPDDWTLRVDRFGHKHLHDEQPVALATTAGSEEAPSS